MSMKIKEIQAESIPRGTTKEMMKWINNRMGVSLPTKPVCPCHDAPADYLWHALFGERDAIVWANRGGGKTFLAALASVAEQLMNPGTRTAVIGGSRQQSERLIDSARQILERMEGDDLVEKITASEIRFAGGGRLTAMPQSQKAVRGLHVPRIRADEVELFDPGVWNALAFAPSTTRKSGGKRPKDPARMDCLSTAHILGGRMGELIATAGDAPPRPKLFKWCVWDVIEHCTPDRECKSCPLQPDCRGCARQADGFYSIDDAILTQARSSRRNWEAEMLCMGPRTESAVFPEFDLGSNAVACPACGALPMYRTMDFGFTGMFVCLWFQVDPTGAVRVVREYARQRLSIDMHAKHMLAMDRELLPAGACVRASFADPSGAAASVATGASIFDQLAAYGIFCTSRQSRIDDGLELVRSKLSPAVGPTMMFIDPSCAGLVKAFQTYRWEGTGVGRSPVKDGADHYIDALRYGLVNVWAGASPLRREY